MIYQRLTCGVISLHMIRTGIQDPYGILWASTNGYTSNYKTYFLWLIKDDILTFGGNVTHLNNLTYKYTLTSDENSLVRNLKVHYLDIERLKRQMFTTCNTLTRSLPQEIVEMIQKEWLKEYNPLLMYRKRNKLYTTREQDQINTYYYNLKHGKKKINPLFRFPSYKKPKEYSKDLEKRMKKLNRLSQRHR